MAPRCLTVLAPIRPGEDDALRAVLRAIGDDIKGQGTPSVTGQPRVDFARSRRTHFARFAILDDPDRGAGRTRLLYGSVYDGTQAEHVAELIDITSNPDGIWGRCEGYTGAGGFLAFINAHACEPEAYYIAFRDETVESIRHATAVGRNGGPLEPVTSRGPRRIHGRCDQAIRSSCPDRGGRASCGGAIGNQERVRRRPPHHGEPRSIPAHPVLQLDHAQPDVPSPVAIFERGARPLRGADAARAGRRDSVGAHPDVGGFPRGRV